MTTITPHHFTFPFSHIITKISFINIPVCPLEYTFSLFFIFFELSFIFISILINPNTISFSQPFNKTPLIYRSVFPNILTITMWMSIFIHSFILILISKMLNSFSMFYKFIEKAYIKHISTLIMTNFCNVNTKTMSFVCSPLSNILITVSVTPKSVSLHRTILKISNIILLIEFK